MDGDVRKYELERDVLLTTEGKDAQRETWRGSTRVHA
jgi:hypothetical protein